MSAELALIVVAAGAAGALLRYLAGLAATAGAEGRRRNAPWATLAVNVAGSLVAGVAIGLAEAGGIDAALRPVLVTGFAGGLTTFSALSVETVELVLARRMGAAVGSIAANLTLGLAAVAAGWALGGALAG